MPGDILGCHNGKGASSGSGPGMPLNTPQCTEEPPSEKDDLATGVNNANIGKPSARRWEHDPIGVNTKSTPSLEASQVPGKCHMVKDLCTYFANTEGGL